MPDAPNVEAFWQNLVQGKRSIREVPPDRWSPADYFSTDRSEREKTYSKIGSFVTGFEFDWRKYRIPPNVARHMDQNQKWAIVATEQCLKDSGYDQKPFDRQRVGVIIGNSGGGEIRIGNTMRIYYPVFRDAVKQTAAFHGLSPDEQARFLADLETRFKTPLQEATEDTMPGELANLIAGRVSNAFNLTGPNFAVDAACASNLAALSTAINYLRAGALDMVVAGAIDASQNVAQFIKFAKIGALSADGCFPFDERADGFVMGEGCALFLLKRHHDAVRDGDKVYAVIRGIGAASDGKGRGVTAPTVEGQVLAIRRALEDGTVDPSTVAYLECHGTGTRLGDHVELEALDQTYGAARNGSGPLTIGSVKSNVGHLKSAAGAVGLLKTVLALHHAKIPPTLGHERPIPTLVAKAGRLEVATHLTPWISSNGHPRRASVSSFGFGGANFHVVLEAPASAFEEGAASERVGSWLRSRLASEDALSGLSPFARLELLAAIRNEFGLHRNALSLRETESLGRLVEATVAAVHAAAKRTA